MKKILTILCGFAVVPAFAFAQTNDDAIAVLQAQIADLLATISALQEQIADLNVSNQELREEVKVLREEFNNTLYLGMSGEEVKALQELLAEDSEIYPEGLITGYFGALTETAVKRFQKKYDIEQVGVFGPKTRAKFNSVHKLGKKDDFTPPGLSKKDDDWKKNRDDDDDDEDEDEDDDKYDDDDDDKWENGKKVTVCHKPGTSAEQTLSVSTSAKKGHLNHGDTVGACGSDDDDDDNSNTTAPIISSAAVTNKTDSSATVSWMTNEQSHSRVEYGTSSDALTEEAFNGTFVLSHSLGLTGLEAETTYYFAIHAKDEAGNTASSSVMSFTTTATPDTTAPDISDLAATSTGSTTASVSWTTDEDSDSVAYFATSTPVASADWMSTSDNSLVTSHSLDLSSLAASSTYYVFVTSTDGSGNTATSTETSFVTQ